MYHRTNIRLLSLPIRVDDDGSIIKLPYSCGKKFTYREETVSDIYSLGELIKSQEDKTKEFIIRGKPLETNRSKIVSRQGEGRAEAAFKDVGRQWMMIDIDDLSVPDWIDARNNPDNAAEWARACLPRIFRNTTCYYQFSTSQSLPQKIGEEPKQILKIHLFFWLDKPITSSQWRRYINE